MKGVKIAAYVVAIVEGISGIIGGIILTVMGALWKSFFGDLFLEVSREIGYDLIWFNELYTVLFIVLGVYLVVLGILNLVFGIRFKGNPKNGNTVPLLVFSILISNVPVVVLLIVYLALSGKQHDQNSNFQEN